MLSRSVFTRVNKVDDNSDPRVRVVKQRFLKVIVPRSVSGRLKVIQGERNGQPGQCKFRLGCLCRSYV